LQFDCIAIAYGINLIELPLLTEFLAQLETLTSHCNLIALPLLQQQTIAIE
jgi:hypothetical protein